MKNKIVFVGHSESSAWLVQTRAFTPKGERAAVAALLEQRLEVSDWIYAVGGERVPSKTLVEEVLQHAEGAGTVFWKRVGNFLDFEELRKDVPSHFVEVYEEAMKKKGWSWQNDPDR